MNNNFTQLKKLKLKNEKKLNKKGRKQRKKEIRKNPMVGMLVKMAETLNIRKM